MHLGILKILFDELEKCEYKNVTTIKIKFQVSC